MDMVNEQNTQTINDTFKHSYSHTQTQDIKAKMINDPFCARQLPHTHTQIHVYIYVLLPKHLHIQIVNP